jgi:tetratricopeptide (TPR) repeat protein
MLRRLLTILIISFSSLHFFAQSECDVLLSKIKKDTEWNINKYFNDIDNALKLNCTENEKIELLLLKSNYLGRVNRTNEALNLLNIAETKLKLIKNNDSLKAVINLRKAWYFANKNNYFESYAEWNKSNNYYALTQNYKGLASCQLVLSNIFLTLKQNDFALKSISKAKVYAKKIEDKGLLSTTAHNLSYYWVNQLNYDSALYYHRIAENYSLTKEDDLSGIYNTGVLYLTKGDTQEAKVYFEKVIKNSTKFNCKGYEGMGKYALSLSYLDIDHDRSFRLMKEALSLIETHNPDLSIQICDCILGNFKEQSEYKTLLPFFENRKVTLQKERENVDMIQVGKLFNMSSSMNEQLIETQKELEKQKKEVIAHEKKQMLLIYLVSLIAIGLIASVYYFYSKIKTKKELEKQFQQQKILLNNSVITISNNSAMSESLSKKLKKIALETTSKRLNEQLFELSESIDKNVLGLKSKELKDLDWLIQSINDGFVKKLCQKYPGLSSNEITLAIYLRMNFNTKQIADLKGASENSVDVARSRLRAKLEIKGENIDLSVFLNKF